jgi:hypothetical protein
VTSNGNTNCPVANIRIDLGAPTLAVVMILVMIIGACGVVMGLNLAKQAQMDQDFKDMKTQDWLKERRLMDREAYDIVNGLKKPGDDAWGPTGNVQRMKPKEK